MEELIPLDVPNIQNIVQPGSYELPFTFKLPSSLPNSCPRKKLDSLEGRLEYSCTARLEIEGTTPIQAREVFKFSRPPVHTGTLVLKKVQEVKGLLGADKGKVDVEVVIPKTGITSGESLNIFFSMNCINCSIGFKRIKCKLYEDTALTDVRKIFVNKTMERIKVMKCYLPGVKEHQKNSYVETLRFPKEFEKRTLESVTGEFIRRNYVLSIVPVFNMIRGDRKLKLETIIDISSLTPEFIPKKSNNPPQNIPAQVSYPPHEVPYIQPEVVNEVTIPPQISNTESLIPIPPLQVPAPQEYPPSIPYPELYPQQFIPPQQPLSENNYTNSVNPNNDLLHSTSVKVPQENYEYHYTYQVNPMNQDGPVPWLQQPNPPIYPRYTQAYKN